jgi:adenylosuccinate synthase
MKAYTTRVGEGPFPTELFDKDGEELRNIGREYGATTGRPRRCGWFDAVAARYSCMVDGIDLLAITKLDCLDGFDKVAICTGYEINGKVTDRFPASLDDLTAVKPVYEWHDGWKQDISGARCWEDLPVNARKYLERVAELVRSKIAIISVGPRRDQTFSVEK